jgi:hypothetical protein
MYNLMAVPVLLAVSSSDTDVRLKRLTGLAGVLGAVTIMFTVSRNGLASLGALLTFIGLTCGSLRLTAKKVVSGLIIVAFLGGFLAATWDDFVKRFEERSLEREYGGKVHEGRGSYLILANLIAEENFWGCGLNNWSWCVSNRFGVLIQQYYIAYESIDAPTPKRRLRRDANVDAAHADPAHSLYAITLGEMGWPGVVCHGVVWMGWFRMTGSFLARRSRSLQSRFGVGVLGALLGAFFQSISEWELRQTPLLFLLHILLGAAAAIWPAHCFRRSKARRS